MRHMKQTNQRFSTCRNTGQCNTLGGKALPALFRIHALTDAQDCRVSFWLTGREHTKSLSPWQHGQFHSLRRLRRPRDSDLRSADDRANAFLNARILNECLFLLFNDSVRGTTTTSNLCNEYRINVKSKRCFVARFRGAAVNLQRTGQLSL